MYLDISHRWDLSCSLPDYTVSALISVVIETERQNDREKMYLDVSHRWDWSCPLPDYNVSVLASVVRETERQNDKEKIYLDVSHLWALSCPQQDHTFSALASALLKVSIKSSIWKKYRYFILQRKIGRKKILESGEKRTEGEK